MRLGGLGAPELILIVLAIVLIFGASKLGDIGGAMGKSIREFKRASKDDEDLARDKVNDSLKDENASVTVRQVTTETTATPIGVSDFRPPDVRTN